MEIKRMAHENFERMDKDLKKWMADRPSAEKRIAEFELQLQQRKLDQQQILLERIRDRDHAEVYTEMLTSCEADIARLTEQITNFRDMDATVKKRKKDMKKSIDLLDSIVADGAVSDAHLRMLVDKITVSEVNGKLTVQIDLNGRFRMHFDSYDESGDMTDRIAECWAFQY